MLTRRLRRLHGNNVERVSRSPSLSVSRAAQEAIAARGYVLRATHMHCSTPHSGRRLINASIAGEADEKTERPTGRGETRGTQKHTEEEECAQRTLGLESHRPLIPLPCGYHFSLRNAYVLTCADCGNSR